MCGITGAMNWGDAAVLGRMTTLQAHRGPDDGGIWEKHLADGSWVGLGNRRLAILDLSSAGHMPMHSQDGNLSITYNGEIYNFLELRAELEAKGVTFRSRTDTEVLLEMYRMYGIDCVKRLNGMFAFAIWDNPRRHLFMARDHFGIKPFYYVQQEERFAFASEIKSLLVLPGLQRKINVEALDQYMTFLWVPDPLTMFEGIFKLQAGHSAIWREGRLEISKYWDLDFPPANHSYPLPEEELARQVRQRLCNAVKEQMVSDVPLGAFLSAGVDSSSIVACMSQITSEPVHTYTITFPPRERLGQISLDDPAVARNVAQRFACDHHEIVVEPEVAGLLPKLVWHMDEPVADPAIIMAYLVCKEAGKKLKVMLSGIGGDELFGGYRKYSAAKWLGVYQSLPAAARKYLLEPAIRNAPGLRDTRWKGLIRLGKKMAKSGSLPPQDAFLMNSTYFDEAQRSVLYAPEYREALVGTNSWSRHQEYFERVNHSDFLNQMLYLDTKVFMVSLNLTYNDKMSMASSVETRVPFLDVGLAEFAAANIPPSMKLRGGIRTTTKYILKKAMQDFLPKEVVQQPKAGFGAPVDRWLAHDLKEMVADLLSPARIKARSLFRPEMVAQLIQEHQSGAQDWSLQIWQLITLEIWMETFMDDDRSQMPSPPPLLMTSAPR